MIDHRTAGASVAGWLALGRWLCHGLVVPQSLPPAGDVHLQMNSTRNTLFSRGVNITAADASQDRDLQDRKSPLFPPQPHPIPVRKCPGPTLPVPTISFEHKTLTRPYIQESRLRRVRETKDASFFASLRTFRKRVAVKTPSLRRPSQAGEPK